MRIESNSNPAADYQVGYVGLIQYSALAAEFAGTIQEALLKMTFLEQIDYVRKYLEKKKYKLTARTDLYLQVMKPNAVRNGNNWDYVIFDESIEDDTTNPKRSLWNDPWVKKYGYIGNPSFMREHVEYDNWVHHPTYSEKTKRARGFLGKKTYVWKVDEVIEYWYLEGLKPINYFSGKCDNFDEESANTEGIVPWVIIANEEYKLYKDYNAKDQTLKVRIDTYSETKTGEGHYTTWCASFVHWCFEQTSD